MDADRVAQFAVIPTAKEAWAKVSGCKTPILLAALLTFVVHLILRLLCGYEPAGRILFFIIFTLVVMPAYVGQMYMGLQRVRGLPVIFNQVFYVYYRKDLLINIYLNSFFYFLFYFNVILLIGLAYELIPVLGVILILVAIVVLPYVLFRFSLTIYFIIDRNENVISALKHSYLATSDYVWKLMIAYLFLLLVYILGLFTLIGLIWVIPFTYIYYGSIYEAISSKEER